MRRRARRRYELSWLYIDLLDECGHKRGDVHPSYAGLIRKVDRFVGGVVSALTETGEAS